MRSVLLARAAVRTRETKETVGSLRSALAEPVESAFLLGHDELLTSAAFSHDGSRIITASVDNTARVWDTEGRELAVLRGHAGVVLSARFSPDGSRILTAAMDKTARLWLVHTKDLLARADGRCIRDFTPEERERYGDLLGDDDDR